MSINKAIDYYIKISGMKKCEVAARAGFSKSDATRVTTDGYKVTFAKVAAYAKATGVKIADYESYILDNKVTSSIKSTEEQLDLIESLNKK